jgi:hypothetical protein
MLGRKRSAITGVCIAIALGATGCGYSSEAGSANGDASGNDVAECEHKMEALDQTAEILEEKGEIQSGQRAPSDVLEERWGSC